MEAVEAMRMEENPQSPVDQQKVEIKEKIKRHKEFYFNNKRIVEIIATECDILADLLRKFGSKCIQIKYWTKGIKKRGLDLILTRNTKGAHKSSRSMKSTIFQLQFRLQGEMLVPFAEWSVVSRSIGEDATRVILDECKVHSDI